MNWRFSSPLKGFAIATHLNSLGVHVSLTNDKATWVDLNPGCPRRGRRTSGTRGRRSSAFIRGRGFLLLGQKPIPSSHIAFRAWSPPGEPGGTKGRGGVGCQDETGGFVPCSQHPCTRGGGGGMVRGRAGFL